MFTDDLDDIDEGVGVLDADNDDGDIFSDAVYGDPDADYPDDDMEDDLSAAPMAANGDIDGFEDDYAD